VAAEQRKSRVTNLSLRAPFVTTARAYHDAGMYPVPLPAKAKKSPPTGFTGFKNDYSKATQKQLDAWLGDSKHKNANVALWLAPGFLGIDVDAYKKDGRDSLDRLEEELGELPATWVTTARADGLSGIRIYRVPEGPAWPGKLGDGIETIHVGHRYIVAPPSIHPELTAEAGEPVPYQWYAPGERLEGFGSLEVPDAADFTDLSPDWVEALSKGRWSKALKEKNLGGKTASVRKVNEWIEERGGEPCALMLTVLEEVIADVESSTSAHDTVTAGFYRLAALSAEGHPGLATAAERLQDAFLAEVGRDDRDGTARGAREALDEWLRQRDSAVKKVMALIDKGEYIGAVCFCTELTPEGKPKRRIDIATYYPPEAMAISYEAIRPTESSGGYGVYHTGGELKELRHGYHESVTVDSLRMIVARHVDWYRTIGGEEPVPVPTNPPDSVLKSMLADHSRYTALPELKGVVRTPFWAMVDGKPELVKSNGYHEGARVFLDMDPQMAAVVEKAVTAPSDEQVKYAHNYIHKVIRSFPFVGDADRAGFYAALLLPFCRDLISGPTPLHIIEAPAAGTGKSLMANAIALIACGDLTGRAGYQTIAMRQGRGRDEEMVKEVGARMIEMPRILLLDNISDMFTSSSLSSSMTSPTFQTRVLGTSKSVEIPNRTLWLGTANNISASIDLVRRSVPIRLDAGVERPAERDGDFTNLYEHIPDHRPSLVWSCLTLVARWVDDGMPAGHWGNKMGSFESWRDVMSGVLSSVGVAGFLDNHADFSSGAANDHEDLRPIIEAMRSEGKLGTRFRASMLLTNPVVIEVMEELGLKDAQALGTALSRKKGNPFGDVILRRGELDGRAAYYLEARDGGDLAFKPRKRRRKAR